MNELELKRLFPNASASTIKANAGDTGICTSKPERAKGVPLEPREEGKGQGDMGTPRRTLAKFNVWSVRPCDADNYLLKGLIDALCHAQILDGDAWNQLAISVVSEKAASREEERTEVTIERL